MQTGTIFQQKERAMGMEIEPGRTGTGKGVELHV